MRTLLNILLTVTVVAGILGFSEPAAAQDVTVRIRSIGACTEGKAFDSELDDLKGKLKKAFRGYSSFKLIDDDQFTLSKKQSHTETVPGGTKVKITFHGTAGNMLRLGLAIGDKLQTTLRASPGSTFFQAGLDYKDCMLILAITAK
ncbi:hypothetical protein FIV42_10950 [Persicimonas caeni]|uniref:Uncharacterized protein n=1 Tax=Persicimonas caeni TaxID=2292766 RepID=A0A4Y6PSG1_PERCE|nr:hypothetical protein [Persicimonas caeni]QDG51238.1 hypothetical protein FIV42_10950 [Persicimonas caeni]QED32459.1 hypothetical protein FRD00_10945 [Persicimonas caeni]